MTTYDAIIVGLGGMGSAAAYQLSKRGANVLGLEQFGPAHDLGSSHGDSRVIRQAYFEHPDYVPLLLSAYRLWRELEAESGEELLTETGGLMMGPPDSEVVKGSLASAKLHGLDYQLLSEVEIATQYPAFSPPPDTVGLLEPRAGFLRPEKCVCAHLKQAKFYGADLHFNTPALHWLATSNGVEVRTERQTYHANHLVITAGPWATQVASQFKLPLTVERQVQYWFDVPNDIELFAPDRFPVYILDMGKGTFLYGFPAIDGRGGGVKVAFYRELVSVTTTAGTVEREVKSDEIERMFSAASTLLPGLSPRCLRAKTCLYTMTPDQHFVIDRGLVHPQVTIAAGFSGHGFKFASVVGEILADLATEGKTEHPISLFSATRFAG